MCQNAGHEKLENDVQIQQLLRIQCTSSGRNGRADLGVQTAHAGKGTDLQEGEIGLTPVKLVKSAVCFDLASASARDVCSIRILCAGSVATASVGAKWN